MICEALPSILEFLFSFLNFYSETRPTFDGFYSEKHDMLAQFENNFKSIFSRSHWVWKTSFRNYETLGWFDSEPLKWHVIQFISDKMRHAICSRPTFFQFDTSEFKCGWMVWMIMCCWLFHNANTIQHKYFLWKLPFDIPISLMLSVAIRYFIVIKLWAPASERKKSTAKTDK